MSHGQSMPQSDSPHHRRFGHGFPPHPASDPVFGVLFSDANQIAALTLSRFPVLHKDYNRIIIGLYRGHLTMARPENRSEARSLSLTLPTETFNYLVLLATMGKLGRTENEVATHILVREAYAMLERGFHEQKIPPAEP